MGGVGSGETSGGGGSGSGGSDFASNNKRLREVGRRAGVGRCLAVLFLMMLLLCVILDDDPQISPSTKLSPQAGVR